MRTLILTLAMLAATPALAAEPQPDAELGRAIAERWCQSCHDISGTTTSDYAPGFRSVAEDPTKSDARLRGWLKDPHPPMPNLSLTNREIADLVAYIRSLADD